jgi:hypothetical protein
MGTPHAHGRRRSAPAVATAITPDAATLPGTVKPDGSPTNYHLDYGTTTNYGSSVPVPDASVAASSAVQPVTQPISGLTPWDTYLSSATTPAHR